MKRGSIHTPSQQQLLSFLSFAFSILANAIFLKHHGITSFHIAKPWLLFDHSSYPSHDQYDKLGITLFFSEIH